CDADRRDRLAVSRWQWECSRRAGNSRRAAGPKELRYQLRRDAGRASKIPNAATPTDAYDTAQTPEKLCHRGEDTPRGLQKMLSTSGGRPNRNHSHGRNTVEALWICHAAAEPVKVTPP